MGTAPASSMESLHSASGLASCMALSQPLDLMALGSQGRSLLAQHRLENLREENPDISGDTPPLLEGFLGSGLDPAPPHSCQEPPSSSLLH